MPYAPIIASALRLRLRLLARAGDHSQSSALAASVAIATQNLRRDATSPVDPNINTIEALVGPSLAGAQPLRSVGLAVPARNIIKAAARMRDRSPRGIAVHTHTRVGQGARDDPQGGVNWYVALRIP